MSDAAFDGALAPYLRWVLAEHGKAEASIAGHRVRAPLGEVPWHGTLAPDRSSQHARSREVDYLRLGLDRSGAGTESDEDKALAARPLPTYLTAESHVDRFDPRSLGAEPAEGLTEQNRPSVVLGDPGSGKTTMVRRLVLDCARAAQDRRSAWRLPVLCRAADLSAAWRKAADDYAAAAAENDAADRDPADDGDLLLRSAIRVGWDTHRPGSDAGPAGGLSDAALDLLAAQAVRRHRLILVVDGLDEVSTRAERARLVALLGALAERFTREAGSGRADSPAADGPGNLLLATSRFVGYYAAPLPDSVRQLILCPMDGDSALATGSFWLKYFAASSGRGRESTAPLLEQFEQLLGAGSAAGGRTVGGTAASNPYLLVSLLSAVASGRLKRRKLRTLGVVRSDLYNYMLEDALDRAPDRFAQAPPREFLLDLHTAMAYRMHRTASGVLDAEGLRGHAAEALGDLGGAAHHDIDTTLRYLRELGLFTDRGQNLFGFIHLTVEEYLAGRWLVEGENAAELIGRHIDDPRWVEPIRLGLGHLGRSAPRRFHTLVLELLRGASNEKVANLVIADLAELDAVRPAHLEVVVRVLLAADVRRTGAHGDSSGTAEALARLRHSQVTLPGDEQPMDVVNRALAGALRTGDQPTLAAAARVVLALGLVDPHIAQALFHAQQRDSSMYGWATVRALQTLYTQPDQSDVRRGTDAVAAAVAELSAQERGVLRTASTRVEWQQNTGFLDRRCLPETLMPFRTALDDATRDRILDGPAAILRLVLVLYGGVAFRDRRRWLEEQKRLEAVVSSEQEPVESRHAAAVQLDVIVLPAIRSLKNETVLDRAQITVDSPLTARLLEWIGQGIEPGVLADRLLAIARDPAEDDAARGDALAGLLSLGVPDTRTDATTDAIAIAADLDSGVRARFQWRLDRACCLLNDAVGGLPVGVLLDWFYANSEATDDVDAAQAVLHAVCALGRVAPDGDGATLLNVRQRYTESLPLMVCARHDDPVYSIAVVLDTIGKQLTKDLPALAGSLARAHTVAGVMGRYAPDWPLDPFGPARATVTAEALTALGALSPRMTFLRCWMLERLLPILVEEGFAVEGLCLALRAYRDDSDSVTRLLRRFARAGGIEGLDQFIDDIPVILAGEGLDAFLRGRANQITNPYARGRAAVQLAVQAGDKVTGAELLGLAGSVADPGDRLRLIELAVSLGVSDWDSRLVGVALRCAARLPDREERILAHIRLQYGLYANLADDLAPPSSPGAEPEPEEEYEPAYAAIAAPLFALERRFAEPPQRAEQWILLTAAALAADGLSGLVQGGGQTSADGAGEWAALEDPARAAEAARALHLLGQDQLLTLDPQRCAVLDTLLAAGHGDLVAQILEVAAMPRRLAAVEAWRACAHQRVADLASLLLIESRQLDLTAVAALPRLLTDPSDATRMRAGIATSVVSRGGGSTPRFTATALGADALAELSVLLVRSRDEYPEAAADLYWALSDVIRDTGDSLRDALAILGDAAGAADARIELLRSSMRLTSGSTAGLVSLLPELSEREQCALLFAVHDAAMDLYRTGISVSAAAELGLRLLGVEKQLEPAAVAQLSSTLGVLIPAEPTARILEERFKRAAALPDGAGAPAAAATAYGLGLLAVRPEIGADVAERIRSRLTTWAADARGELGIALLGGILRNTDRAAIDRVLAADRPVDHADVMWALMADLDMPGVGAVYYHRVARICDYIRDPPGLTGDAAAAHTSSLTEALFTRLGELLDVSNHNAAPGRFDPSRQHWKTYNLVSVAAELAKAQPVPARLIAETSLPGLRAQLIRGAGSDSWMTRLHSARLLAFLGSGDRPTVSAILQIAKDTDYVRQAVLSDLRWFESIRPDGFATLVEAVDHPSPARCRFAMQMLASLVEHRALAEEERAIALHALEHALDRDDASDQVILEISGELVQAGTYAEAGRRLLTRLSVGEPPLLVHTEQLRLAMTVADESGGTMELVASVGIDGAPSLLSSQSGYYGNAEMRTVPGSFLDAYNRVASVARTSRVPLDLLLEAAKAD